MGLVQRLLSAFRLLVGLATGGPGAKTRRAGWPGRNPAAAARDAARLRVQNAGGGIRKETVTVLGGEAQADGVAGAEETFTFFQDGIQTEVTVREARFCSCGSTIDAKNALRGQCVVCGATLCAREACSAGCEYCGALICRRHLFTLRKHSFCTRCRLYALWAYWWGRLE